MSKEASTHIDLSEVIAYAQANESPWAREPGADGAQWGIHRLDPPPHNRLLGPVSARGPASGVILLGGREVAHWGEPDRPDLTFSIAKTYLALLAGVAFDRGLIADLDAPIGASVHGIGFEGAHNGSISWRHMLQMCSEWSGACWGIPDQVDHFRTTTPPWPGAEAGTKGEARTLCRAGTYWEYNDVRVNQFSLALLHLFGRPLPEVFREAIAGPAGASDDWRWDGYDNAWTTVQGRKMQSVPGGTHWGGGVTISARDQARIGQMLLRRGLGETGRVLSGQWIDWMTTPSPLASYYGFLVWLNASGQLAPGSSRRAYMAMGAGASITWIDPSLDLVAAVRWIDSTRIGAFADRLSRAVATDT